MNVVTECIKEYQEGKQITSVHSIHKNLKNSSSCLRSALHGRYEFNEENSEASKNDPDVLETNPWSAMLMEYNLWVYWRENEFTWSFCVEP